MSTLKLRKHNAKASCETLKLQILKLPPLY